MIDWEKLNQFIHEELRYKEDVTILYCRQLDSFFDVKLSCPNNQNDIGEIIEVSRYNNWLKKFDRDENINKILED